MNRYKILKNPDRVPVTSEDADRMEQEEFDKKFSLKILDSEDWPLSSTELGKRLEPMSLLLSDMSHGKSFFGQIK